MSEIGDAFKFLKEERKRKKVDNVRSSMEILRHNGHIFSILSKNGPHLRIMDFDFWPSTGKFINSRTKKHGRGIFNLLRALNETKEN